MPRAPPHLLNSRTSSLRLCTRPAFRISEGVPPAKESDLRGRKRQAGRTWEAGAAGEAQATRGALTLAAHFPFSERPQPIPITHSDRIRASTPPPISVES